MTFCTAINCMDGRTQLPVIRYLQARFNAQYVDMITAAGPNRILALNDPPATANFLLQQVHLSLEKHHSRQIAVIGHDDCAGNPAPPQEQQQHLMQAVRRLQQRHGQTAEIIALWLDASGRVHELSLSPQKA